MTAIRIKDFSGGLFAGGAKGPQAIAPKEQQVSKSIQSFLDKRGIYNDRLNAGRVMVVKTFRNKDGSERRFETWLQLAKKGSPDRFFILGGRIYFIEVKRKGKKPTPEQIERHDELRRAGAHIFVADSIDSFIQQFNERFQLSS